MLNVIYILCFPFFIKNLNSNPLFFLLVPYIWWIFLLRARTLVYGMSCCFTIPTKWYIILWVLNFLAIVCITSKFLTSIKKTWNLRGSSWFEFILFKVGLKNEGMFQLEELFCCFQLDANPPQEGFVKTI